MEAPAAAQGDVEAMARAVAVHASRQHTKDDVSVVVLRLTSQTPSFISNGFGRS